MSELGFVNSLCYLNNDLLDQLVVVDSIGMNEVDFR
jgi:hypothetical protein